MINAKVIMLHSNHGFDKKPNPNNGKLVINNGTIAQCMAHNTEAVIPTESSLDFFPEDFISQIYPQMQWCCILYPFFTNPLYYMVNIIF
jgi:hypothetical protein